MRISEIKMFSCKIVLDLLYILVSAGFEIGVVLNEYEVIFVCMFLVLQLLPVE